jgi:hypothetical protein
LIYFLKNQKSKFNVLLISIEFEQNYIKKSNGYKNKYLNKKTINDRFDLKNTILENILSILILKKCKPIKALEKLSINQMLNIF